MKKLISILMALSMLFTFAAIPSMAEDVSITNFDFTSDENIAYGKKVTVLNGTSSKPERYTDGDITTTSDLGGGSAYPKKNFRIDLEKVYEISEVSIYCNGGIQRALNLYVGTEENNGGLVMSLEAGGGEIYTEDGKDYLKYTFTLGKEIYGRYLIIEHPTTNNFYPHEVYAIGTEVAEDFEYVSLCNSENIAFGKKVVDLGYGSYYTGTWPSLSNDGTKNNLTDASLVSAHSGTGDNRNQNRIDGALKFRLDLTQLYNVTELTFYMTTNKGFNIYATEDIKFEGTDPVKVVTGSELTAVTLNGVSENLYVVTVPLSDVKAQFITMEFIGSSGFGYREVTAKGTPVEEVVDFTDEKNIAYGKKITHIAGSHYSSGPAPSETNQKATDGDINTLHSAYGKSGSTVLFRIDLEKYYNLKKFDIYLGSAKDFNIYIGSDIENKTLAASVPAYYGQVSFNGKILFKHSIEATTPIIGRYIWVEYVPNSGFPYYEIYAEGDEVAEFIISDKAYSYSTENGASASVSFFNGDEIASTAGKIYFAAYNNACELVGIATADIASLAKGQTATVAPAAFKVSEEPAYVKAFYWADKLIPVTEPISFK